MMWRLFALAAVLLTAVSSASACSCGPPDPVAVEASADMVFEGAVLDQKVGLDLAGKKAAVIRVRVLRMIKGERPPSGVVTIYSPWSPAMCGVVYPPAFEGRFGTRSTAGGPVTNNCIHFALNLDYFRRRR